MSSSVRILGIDELHGLTRKPKDGKSRIVGEDNGSQASELWACLIETVRSSTVSDKHMTAACNAICYVVRANAQSRAEALKTHAYDQETWRHLFGAARSAFASGKNKPALQVLDTLHYLARTNPDSTSAVHNVEEAITIMIRIVLSHHPRRCLKEACIMLYFFLRKLSDFMSFSEVLRRALDCERMALLQLCHASGMLTSVPTHEAHPPWFALVLTLLLAVRYTESRSATLKLLALLCELPFSAYQVDVPSILSRCIDTYSSTDEAALEAVTRDVLPSVLTTQDLFQSFLSRQQQFDKSNSYVILVVLTLLQYGKNKGFVAEAALPSTIFQYCLETDASAASDHSYDPFMSLLSHGSAPVRTRACELLLSSTSPNSPLPTAALTCLTANLGHLHDDIDAYHRGELLSILRRFLTRIQQSHRALENSRMDDAQCKTLHEYNKFYDRYFLFITQELSAGSSYPRHILALQLLDLASKTTLAKSAMQEKLFSDQIMLSNLFRLVLDPYEDVRALATEIISRVALEEPHHSKNTIRALDPSTTISSLAATTNRADHADALGRVLSLVSTQGSSENRDGLPAAEFERLARLSQQFTSHVLPLPVFEVSSVFPLHGVILGIAYMVEKLTNGDTAKYAPLINELLKGCQNIWILSQSHLCIDSPEMESESIETDNSGPKDRLAYAWRALRDSNLMMQAMLEHLEPDITLLECIGDMCFNQLALLRHRGAFSTVAQTFVLCCQKARESQNSSMRGLNDRWFSEAMEELEKQADKLTRRSAGLPAMFAAAIDPTDKAKFTVCFQALVGKAVEKVIVVESNKTEDKLRLPQVHALNCIKEIMTSSRFRVLTEPLVIFTLNLAADCMTSKIWAIKNCGLMLLRASINRLDPDTGLGYSEAGMKLRAVSETERRPVDVAMNFLSKTPFRSSTEKGLLGKVNENSSDESTEALFAGLDILGRLYIELNELKNVKYLVADQLGHPLWHIRAQASRLSAIITPRGSELALLHDLFSKDQSALNIGPNKMHGILMLMGCLVQRLCNATAKLMDECEVISLLLQTLKSRVVRSHSNCMAEWLSVANQLFENRGVRYETVKGLLDASEQMIAEILPSLGEEDALCERQLALFSLRCYTLFGTMHTRTFALLRECADDVFVYTLATFRPDPGVHSSLRYLEVLVSVTEGRQSQHCRAAIMQAFTTNLPHTRVQVDAAKLTCLTELLDFSEPPSRELLNNSLSFFAALCRYAWAQQDTMALDCLISSTRGFCLYLRTAANDETEYDTRWSTIAALQQWKFLEDLPRMLKHLFKPMQHLDILSVLYDLLNDDDEEIRAEASDFTVALLKGCNDVSTTAIRSLCAAASRRQLRDYLSKKFSGTQLLRDECLRRVLGKQMICSRSRLRSESGKLLHRGSFSSDLGSILDGMRELFIEEKQNLYIDESAEVEVWAFMLSSMSFSEDLGAVGRLADCAVDGAEQLNAIFEGKHPWSYSLFCLMDNGGIRLPNGDIVSRSQPQVMFGTSLTESLELHITRVVVSLRLSGKSDCVAYKRLQENCVELKMSQTLLSAFTSSLR